MFALDEKLQADSFAVCELELSSLRLMNDANYLWLILVPRKENLIELIDLDFSDQITLLHEINAVSQLLKNHFNAEKLNVANLGNVVSQLHFHLIARQKNDLAFPKPVWNFAAAKPYSQLEAEELILKIKSLLLRTIDNKSNSNHCAEVIRPLFIEENEATTILRKKIFYRANHRGCKETDFLLGKFFSAKLSNLEEFGLDLCAKFIDEDDLLIYDWILGRETTPKHYKTLIAAIQEFHCC